MKFQNDHPSAFRLSVGLVALLTVAGCSVGGPGFDFRNVGPNTNSAARSASATRPQPDANGIITYPNYQVIVANRGDTVASIAQRIGTEPNALARFNGIPTDVPLRQGEVLALNTPIGAIAPSGTTGNGIISSTTIAPAPGGVDIGALAGDAIARADAPVPAPVVQAGPEPTRHKVVRGETAFSIARLHGVTPQDLADWNGLGGDLAVREGQFLLIPVASEDSPRPIAAPDSTSAPGQGSETPTPPSSTLPLPATNETPTTTVESPASPNLSEDQTAVSQTRLLYPVNGRIIRPYVANQNEGIDIGAAPGTAVKAAEAGTVAAITQDTDQVPIIVIRHAGNLLTVYANVDNIKISKDANVARGQTIADVRAGSPSFLHFEVREGFESVDPIPFLE